MENKINYKLKFMKVFLSDKDYLRIKDKVSRLIKRAYNLNREFFSVNIKKLTIEFVYSRKEMNFLWGSRTDNYVAGFSKKNKIVIFSPNIIKKQTCWEEKDFYSTLVHEMNHIFYQKYVGTYKPVWLSEGLASYFQGGKNKINKRLKIPKNIFSKSFKIDSIKKYDFSYLLVKFLIKKYKKEKFFSLLKLIKKLGYSPRLLERVYKKTTKQIIEDANKNY